MLGDVAISHSQINALPKVGDNQYLRLVREEAYQVKYTLTPMPGATLAIVGLEEPA